MTRAQLRDAGLRLRPGQRRSPRAWLYCMPRHHHAPLYAIEQGSRRPALSERQLAALAAGREKWWKARACTACDGIHDGWCQEAVGAMWIADRTDAAAWAAGVLADPASCILDTETTGLDDGASIVEIAVLSIDGRVLLDTLVNPGRPIPEAAAGVHGITTAKVAGAPSFSEVLPELTAALDGRKVVIYNQPFDKRRLAVELHRHYRARWVNLEKGRRLHPQARAWLAAQNWDRCAMEEYSAWCGDVWWDYEREEPSGYRWQPLNGGHRALGDCRAVIDRLKEMAANG